ncbi:M1 family metallopeptidase [Hymenobacter taeanensis]|uniref:Aminopeptidase N n=1 Tax=Hymenobacter taeanensis TaxID=2735321 RepID=A0A6M6BN92_9BACT|nr:MULTISPECIES: M1 family metallopeptidase [Hymenobacter]QJX48973.1 M1 family metallopeptidase [Hymenobacter taeanensis]UOQ81511.1 M1 family metallopeptidase [Hymenobacter sp. 5414T-23]
MRNILVALLGLGVPAVAPAQSAPAASALSAAYRATPRKVNALVHTKLEVRFDYARCYLYGQEWVTLRPHGYPTDSLRLDAQGMDIKAVSMVMGQQMQPLKHEYTQQQLLVHLGKMVPAGEAYTVYIEYTAKPEELKKGRSTLISEGKGLYFINPDSAVAGKPVQIWTQGETDANSVWFPTIDQPSQKTTAEISLTVPSKYVTLSNGRLAEQTAAGPGLRRDTWKQELPHSPYLFMMAVGDFKITKDTWRGKEVSYYLEPKYAAQTQQIFGKTPRMLEFFSQRLGVEYPWNKYAQIVVRNYPSGAMENTSASLFGEQAQGSARELLDWEYAGVEREIAHELFHHWFGDLVTAESWSNLTVNESFANFSEVLWAEHEYGPDAGEEQADRSLRNYLRSTENYDKPLVRFQYADKEHLFDNVTYQKGGSILYMLRSYLGEKVFFNGLQRYLKQHAFGNGEAHQLRLALEEASGQDLNWFFNQWYYRVGHPTVQLDYQWNASRKQQAVIVHQTQAGVPFILPLAIDVYTNGRVKRHQATLRQAVDTLYFSAATKPDLVNVDAEKVLVWQKTDNKSVAEYAYLYQHAPRYLDRREALAATKGKFAERLAQQTLVAGLTDKSAALRQMAIELLDLQQPALRKAATPALVKLATADASVQVQAAALTALGTLKNKQYTSLFTKALASASYKVQGAALLGLLPLDAKAALSRATAFEADNKGSLTVALVEVYGKEGGPAQWPLVLTKFDAAGPNDQFTMLTGLSDLLVRIDQPAAWLQGVNRIKELAVRYKPYGVHKGLLKLLGQLQQQAAGTANAAQVTALVTQATAEIEAAK